MDFNPKANSATKSHYNMLKEADISFRARAYTSAGKQLWHSLPLTVLLSVKHTIISYTNLLCKDNVQDTSQAGSATVSLKSSDY